MVDTPLPPSGPPDASRPTDAPDKLPEREEVEKCAREIHEWLAGNPIAGESGIQEAEVSGTPQSAVEPSSAGGAAQAHASTPTPEVGQPQGANGPTEPEPAASSAEDSDVPRESIPTSQESGSNTPQWYKRWYQHLPTLIYVDYYTMIIAQMQLVSIPIMVRIRPVTPPIYFSSGLISIRCHQQRVIGFL